jgi:hypothetical protein
MTRGKQLASEPSPSYTMVKVIKRNGERYVKLVFRDDDPSIRGVEDVVVGWRL